MKGYTIQNSIDLLEKSVENGGSSTAADVSYDNTSSHLTADDVQEAIDELNTAIGQIDTGINFGTTERQIGTYKGAPLYAKIVEFGALPNNTTKSVAHEISDLSQVVGYFGMAYDAANFVSLPYVSTGSFAGQITITISTTNIIIGTGMDRSGLTADITILYTKTAPVTNTRKRKKEE